MTSHAELFDKLLLQKFTEIDDEGNFLHPPKNDEELLEFIRIAFDMSPPKTVVMEGHSSPANFICDLFFERVRNALAFASRHAGKTLSVAMLNFLDMFFKPGCEIASCGAVKSQANRCYRYFLQFLELRWFKDFREYYKSKMGEDFLVKANISDSAFANGSMQEIITASEKGLRSPHPQKARLDEIDLIEWEVLQTGLSMASSKGKILGQNVFTSTRQYEDGSMQKLLDCAAEKGIAVYQWAVWEMVEKCKRRCVDDPEHGTCPLWTKACKGKAHYSDGFFPIEDFIDKARLLDQKSFETEWENKRPQRGSLVFPDLDYATHVISPKDLYRISGYYGVQSHWRQVSGIDFGISPGHPFVYLKFAQLPTGPWILFHEYHAEQTLIRDHVKAIKKSGWRPGELIYSDWTGQERAELADAGIKCKLADKDVRAGINYVRTLISGYPPDYRPQLLFMNHCTFAVREMMGYKWKEGSDKPMKRSDNAADACRYALYSLKKKGAGSYRVYQVDGL